MKLVVEVEVEEHPETEEERHHFEVIKVTSNGEELESELSMDRSGSRYWPFFSDESGFMLSVIADQG